MNNQALKKILINKDIETIINEIKTVVIKKFIFTSAYCLSAEDMSPSEYIKVNTEDTYSWFFGLLQKCKNKNGKK